MIFCAFCHYVFYDCSGGIALTVQGESLESVAVHVMEITMVYKKRNPTSGQVDTTREEKFTGVSTCSNIYSHRVAQYGNHVLFQGNDCIFKSLDRKSS